MTIRKSVALSTILAVSALSFAGAAAADTAWHPVKDERGFVFVPEHFKSDKTRAQVQNEAKLARDFGAGKVSPDGWRYVGGGRVWVSEAHKIEYRDGKWVHVDTIDHSTPRPSPKMTAKEQAQFNASRGGPSN